MKATRTFAALPLAMLSAQFAGAQDELPYGVQQVETNLMKPMRDGIRLGSQEETT